MRNTLIAAGIVVVLAIAYGVYETRRPQMTLEIVAPRAGTIRAYVEEQAVTRLPRETLIAMPIAGWLQPIELREGDTVAAEQVVAQLDEADLRDRVLQAEARIARLENQIREVDDNRLEEHALTETLETITAIAHMVAASEAKLLATRALREFDETELERVTGLMEAGQATDLELREAQLALKRSFAEFRSDELELAALKTVEAISHIGPKFIRDYTDRKSFTKETRQRELDEARAELQIVQRDLERTQIASPIAGVVLERHQTRRQYLSAGTPLLTIGRMDELEVLAEVLTEQATQLAPDDAVEIFGQTLADGPIAGRVTRIYPAGFTKISSLGVEQQRVNVTIAIDRRPEVLGVGFRVYVRIFHDSAENALIVPRTTLVRTITGQWRAIVVRAGLTELRDVTVGLTNDDEAQIVAGLSAADRVVLRPSREIEAGVRVNTRAAPGGTVK